MRSTPFAFLLCCLTVLHLYPAAHTLAVPLRTFVIGDSLSAEYETVGTGIPNFEEGTAYANVTVPAWVSMSWVEVLAALRPGALNFGQWNSYSDFRVNGYEYNYAIPGSAANDWDRMIDPKTFSDLGYASLFLQSEFNEDVEDAECVVVWLGANEFRANYGFLYDGGNPNSLISGLIADLETVIDHVKGKNSAAKIVVCNLPHLGASPDKRAAHGISVTGIGRVTLATETANQQIAALATEKGAVLADVYAQTAAIVNGNTSWFGAVRLYPDLHADNHPRYQFTRDGLHPNTCGQIEIARRVITSINAAAGVSIAQITDGEALDFLGIDPNEPYFEWLAANNLPSQPMDGDSDNDGASNLMEYAFRMDPADPLDNLPELKQQPAASGIRLQWPALTARRVRHVRLTPEFSDDLTEWDPVPQGEVTETPDGMHEWASGIEHPVFLRLRVELIE